MLNKSVLSMNLTPDKLKPPNSEKKSVPQRMQLPRPLSRKEMRKSDSKTSRSKRRMPELELKMRGEERRHKKPMTRETEKSPKRTPVLPNGIENNSRSVNRTLLSEERTRESKENGTWSNSD